MMKRLPDAETARKALNAAVVAGELHHATIRQGEHSPYRGATLEIWENPKTGKIVAAVHRERRGRFICGPSVPDEWLFTRRDTPAQYYSLWFNYERFLRLAGAYLIPETLH